MGVTILSYPSPVQLVRVSGWSMSAVGGLWSDDYGSPWRNWATENVYPIYDVVLRLLGATHHVFGDVRFDDLFGFSSPEERLKGTRQIPGEKPVVTRYKSPDDDKYPTNLLNSYVFAVDRNSNPARRAISRDRNLVHHNVVGNAKPSYASLRRVFGYGTRTVVGVSLPSIVSAHWPISYQESEENGPMNWVYMTEDSGPLTFSIGEMDQYRPFSGPMAPVLEYLKGSASTFTQNFAPNGRLCTYSLHDFDYAVTPTSVTWDYTFEQTLLSFGYSSTYSRWRIKGGIVLSSSGFVQYRSTGWKQPRGLIVSPFYEFELLECTSTVLTGPIVSYVTQVPYEGSVTAPRDYDNPLEYGPSPESVPYYGDLTQDHLGSEIVSVASRHGQYWESELPALRTSAVYSFHNAISGQLLLLKNNYLEVLKELPDLPSLVPDISALFKIMQLLKDGRLFKAGTSAADLLTSFNLQYSFGIAPTGGVIKELADQLPSLQDLFSKGAKVERQDFYGSFIYNFSEDESWGDTSKLITRSKVNATFAPHPVWNAILSLYGVGVIPSLQNVWENIMGSFALDWIGNFSARFRAIDMSLLAMALQFNCFEHSYTITSRVPDTDRVWQSFEVDQSVIQPKFYARDISFTVPQLTDSKYDFLRVQGNPNSGILGSLLYQFLKF